MKIPVPIMFDTTMATAVVNEIPGMRFIRAIGESWMVTVSTGGRQPGKCGLPPRVRSLRDTGDLNQSLTAVTGKGLTAWWKAWVKSLND